VRSASAHRTLHLVADNGAAAQAEHTDEDAAS
jgi:hypothetical protein